MNRRSLIFCSALLLLFTGIMLFWLASESRRSPAVTEGTTTVQAVKNHAEGGGAPRTESTWVDFELTDQHGRTFNSDSLKGKVWVGGVFFSSCTSVCRAQNQQMAKLQQKFSDRGVELVAITCDPDRDTPEALANYARLFNAEKDVWHFLTGDFDLVQQIGWNMFCLPVEREVHSDRLVIFDQTGASRGAFRSIDVNQFEELLSVLEEVVAETEAGDGGSENQSEVANIEG